MDETTRPALPPTEHERLMAERADQDQAEAQARADRLARLLAGPPSEHERLMRARWAADQQTTHHTPRES